MPHTHTQHNKGDDETCLIIPVVEAALSRDDIPPQRCDGDKATPAVSLLCAQDKCVWPCAVAGQGRVLRVWGVSRKDGEGGPVVS